MFMQTYEVITGTGIWPTVLTDMGIFVLCLFYETTHGVYLINLCDCFLGAGLLSLVLTETLQPTALAKAFSTVDLEGFRSFMKAKGSLLMTSKAVGTQSKEQRTGLIMS